MGYFSTRLKNPQPGKLILELAVGILFIILGLMIRKNPEKAKKPAYIAVLLSIIVMIKHLLPSIKVGHFMPQILDIIWVTGLIILLLAIIKLKKQNK